MGVLTIALLQETWSSSNRYTRHFLVAVLKFPHVLGRRVTSKILRLQRIPATNLILFIRSLFKYYPLLFKN